MPITLQCTCGQSFTVPDQNAGLEVRCPSCSNFVQVPGTAAQPIGYHAAAEGACIVTPRAVEMLRQTTLWVRIMSVLMFIGSGFMMLGGVAMLLLGLVARGDQKAPALLGCVYIPMALLYIVPAFFLWRYAGHSKSFALTRHEQSLEDALQAQKSFWKFVAITALVVIGIYLILIPIVIVAAVVGHRP